jgi:hypothetical protein
LLAVVVVTEGLVFVPLGRSAQPEWAGPVVASADSTQVVERTIRIEKKYLLLPIDPSADLKRTDFYVDRPAREAG